ncbi:MAG: hypothetical protein H7X95_06355, partial [Deltaproteobacteria bacterium]|nr:hypothetical protein [Deltaproteobacteria bacterium]
MFHSLGSKKWSSMLMGAASLLGVLSGCHAPGANENTEDVALVVLQLAMVPADVRCIEVSITGSQTLTQKFDVMPGQTTALSIPNLTAGAVTINERAFSVACASVVATTAPTWVAQAPAMVTLVIGQTVDLTLVMKRPPGVRINNDFQDGNTTPPSIAIVGGLDGFLFTKPCLDGGAGFDCVTTSPCPMGGAFTEQNFPIGGT